MSEEKPLDGNQKRKLRLKREEQARRDHRKRLSGVDDPLAAYRDIGPPPKDPVETLVWVQNVMKAAMYEVMLDPVITAEKRWSLLADFGAKLGMTHSKTILQARVAKVVKKDKELRDPSGGLELLPHDFVRPDTARSGASTGDEQPLLGPMSNPETRQDEGSTSICGGDLGSSAEEVLASLEESK